MKLSTFFALASITLLSGSLLAQVDAPRVGILRCADRTVRPILGLQDNFILGDAVFASADAVSFSDRGGLAASNGSVYVVAPSGHVLGQYSSSERHPVLSIERDLTTAIAYLPSEQTLLRWNGRSFSPVRLATAASFGTISSIELQDTDSARLLATTPDNNVSEITVSLDTGQTASVRLLPSIQGPAFLYDSLVLFQDKEGLEIEAANGARRTLSIAAEHLVVERMASQWLHITSSDTKQSWALNLSGGTLHLSEIPAAPPKTNLRRGSK